MPILHFLPRIRRDSPQREIVRVGVAAVARAIDHMDMRELIAHHGGAAIARGVVDHPDVERELRRAGLDGLQAVAQQVAGVIADDNDRKRGHATSSSFQCAAYYTIGDRWASEVKICQIANLKPLTTKTPRHQAFGLVKGTWYLDVYFD